MSDFGDALAGLGAGFSGNGLEWQKTNALKTLGMQLQNGEITQQQYLQQLAMSDPAAARAVAGVDTPSPLKELAAYQTMTPEQQQTYWNIKRAAPVVNLGGSQAVLSPSGTGQPVANLPVTLKPEDQPQNAAAKAGAVDTAKVEAERQAGYAKANAALTGFEQQAKLVTDNIDKAINIIDKPGSAATGYARILSGGGTLPNSDARELDNYLKTIKANVGFDKLQQMRENSPTGGALGQVSDMENKLLQAVNGALDPLQSDQLKENLGTIKELYPQVLQERKKSFDTDYGKFAPQKTTAAAATNQGQSYPGAAPTVRYNAQGQKATLVNGQWVIE